MNCIFSRVWAKFKDDIQCPAGAQGQGNPAGANRQGARQEATRGARR